MSLKKIIIYQNRTLFDILNEIKEKFNFDLYQADNKNIDKTKEDLKKNFLVILNEENKEYKNHLNIEKLPIKLEKLIESINLKFLKLNFNNQSNVSIGSYKLNFNSREITKDNITISLTEREINLIIFLKQKNDYVKIDELQKEVWEYGSDLETHTVETHIYRLRKKVKENFNDENFIVSSKEGYLIN